MSDIVTPAKQEKTVDEDKEEETPLMPIVVDDDEMEDDDLIGQAVENEDELEENRDDHDALLDEAQIKREEPEIPMFRYRNSVTSASYVVKVGNKQRETKRSRPASISGQKRIDFFQPPTKRSRSEQPVPNLDERSISPVPQVAKTNTPPASRASTPQAPMKRRMQTTLSETRKTIQVCPICSRAFEVDNTGLNAHIDYCLSRGAILEATSATSSSSKKSLRNSERKL